MDLLLLIIAPILIVVIGYWAQIYVLQSSKKELNRYKDTSKTKYPKRLFMFFLVGTVLTSFLFVLFGLVIYITNEFEQSTQWIAYLISGFVIFAIPFVGFINTITTYELIKDDMIVVKRWFKSRQVLFNDIKEYSYNMNQLTVYDIHDEVVLFIGDNRVGVKNVITVLENNNIFKK